MCRLVGLIVFCGMCMSVYSDADGKDCIFDWESFVTQAGSPDIVIDYSGQKISTLEEEGTTYHYITGPLKTNAVLDDSYDVICSIQRFMDDNVMTIVLETRKVCYFAENTYADYLLPIGGTHNDFPPQENICPVKEGTTHIYPAENSKELISPSKLDKGKYYVLVSFLKNNNPVGGFRGNFTVLRD